MLIRGCPTVAANGLGLGEVAEPDAKYNYKTLNLKTNELMEYQDSKIGLQSVWDNSYESELKIK